MAKPSKKRESGAPDAPKGMDPMQAFLAMAHEYGSVDASKIDEKFKFLYVPDLYCQWGMKRPGYVLGRIKTTIGAEGCGKSSELYSDCALAIRQGGLAAIVALEEADTSIHIRAYAQELTPMIRLFPAKTLEEGIQKSYDVLDMFEKIDPEGKIPKVLGFDSVAGATMEKLLEEDAEPGQPKPGGIGAIMADFVNVMKTRIVPNNCLWHVINQAREAIPIGWSAMFQQNTPMIEKLVAKGGKALPFHSSYFEVLTRGSTLKVEDEEGDKLPTGFAITKQWKKNKTGTPFDKISYLVEWHKPFNFAPITMEVLASGRVLGVQVEKKRYWCDRMGITKEHRMKAEEIYPLIHSPQWMPYFQQELGVITTNMDMAVMSRILPGTNHPNVPTIPDQPGYVPPVVGSVGAPPPDAAPKG